MKRFAPVILVFAVISAVFLPGCHRHTLVFNEEKTPDCLNDGNIAFYECSDCGLRFLDEKAENAVSDVSVTRGGHRYEPTGFYTDRGHTEKCTVCGDETTVSHFVTPVEGRNTGHFYSGECACGYKTVFEELPVIWVTTADGDAIGIRNGVSEGKEYNSPHEYEDVSITVDSHGEGYDLSDVAAEMKIRGNYSTTYSDKKPYRIKFAKKQKMLGLNEDLEAKSWVLLAEFKDRSLMRNATAFYLGNEILKSDGYFCSDFRFVELYINEEYRGVYLLCEQQQTGTGRVDIPEPSSKSKDVNTGYFFELDYYSIDEKETERFEIDYPSGFTGWDGVTVPQSLFMRRYSIKSDITDIGQMRFIQKTVGSILKVVSDALNDGVYQTINDDGDVISGSFNSKKECIESVLDLRSLVDSFILNEICMDIDVGYSSFFLSLDMSKGAEHKIVFEAPWDWDSSLGFAINAQNFIMSAQIFPSDGQTGSPTPRSYVNPWLVILAGEDWYREMIIERWGEIR
ncbi:MAG: CotH kinase family protein, partial [Clostridia bacterium]|nr:CotH kinase family protein [Clostridia bacterium]